MNARDEYRALRREVRADQIGACDTSPVRRCRFCGGVQSVHYGQPPECDCDTPEVEIDARHAFDEEEEP